jgi:hypothetical protein
VCSFYPGAEAAVSHEPERILVVLGRLKIPALIPNSLVPRERTGRWPAKRGFGGRERLSFASVAAERAGRR